MGVASGSGGQSWMKVTGKSRGQEPRAGATGVAGVTVSPFLRAIPNFIKIGPKLAELKFGVVLARAVGWVGGW